MKRKYNNKKIDRNLLIFLLIISWWLSAFWWILMSKWLHYWEMWAFIVWTFLVVVAMTSVFKWLKLLSKFK